MRAALSNLREPQPFEERHHLPRLEDRQLGHAPLRYFDGLRADEDAFEARGAIFQQHFDDFVEVGPEFVKRIALAVRARKTRNPADVYTGISVAFDDGREVPHVTLRLPTTISDAGW
jgi:hypothetical protein